MTASELYKRSLDYFNRRLLNNLTSEKQTHFTNRITTVVKLLDSYNTYLILTPGYEKRIWEDLVNNSNEMGKFIIEETGLYIRNCFNDDDEIYSLMKLIASSYSALSGENSVLDESLLNKLPDQLEAINILNHNIWLMTLILVKDALDDRL